VRQDIKIGKVIRRSRGRKDLGLMAGRAAPSGAIAVPALEDSLSARVRDATGRIKRDVLGDAEIGRDDPRHRAFSLADLIEERCGSQHHALPSQHNFEGAAPGRQQRSLRYAVDERYGRMWPPWKRTTYLPCSENQSKICLPSSPHWAPTDDKVGPF